MRLSVRDGVATLLLAAVLVPYVGFLANGSMPFIVHPLGMSATALILGMAALLTAGRLSGTSGIGLAELTLGTLTLAVGVVAVLLAGTTAAYTLLALLIALLVLTWAVQMVHHSGVLGSGPVPTR